MFYSGHGDPDKGGWLTHQNELTMDFSESLIVFEELWDIILQSEFTGGVEITSDSCYSGRVCEEAERLWNNKD